MLVTRKPVPRWIKATVLAITVAILAIGIAGDCHYKQEKAENRSESPD